MLTDMPSTTPAPIESPVVPPAESRVPQATRATRLPIHTERAQRLGERFNLPISAETPPTFGPDPEATCLERSTRPWILTTCHECNTTFGGSIICATCTHPRCPKCPRYPPIGSGTSGENKENRQTGSSAAGDIEVDDDHGKEKEVLTKQGKSGERQLVKKKITQRVRRTCHLCTTLYTPASRICLNCSHTRCSECPRDP